VQQFEMDDDLGDSNAQSPGYGGKVIPGIFRTAGAIWPAANSQVNLAVYSDDPQDIDLRVGLSGGAAVLQQSGRSTPSVPFTARFNVVQEESHVLQARLSRAGMAPARIYVKTDHIGPATSNLF
jgi:hypothetical protein